MTERPIGVGDWVAVPNNKEPIIQAVNGLIHYIYGPVLVVDIADPNLIVAWDRGGGRIEETFICRSWVHRVDAPRARQ
jgi:hypothetical protein